MNLNNIIKLIEEEKDIYVYNVDLHSLEKLLIKDYNVIYLSGTKKPKQRLLAILNELGLLEKKSDMKKSIDDLKPLLEGYNSDEKIVLLVNNFEETTKSSSEFFSYLMKLNIFIFVFNANNRFKRDAFTLYKKLTPLVDEFEEEINVKYSLFLLFAAMGLIFYLKLYASVSVLGVFVMMAAIWFALTLFKTFTYIAR